MGDLIFREVCWLSNHCFIFREGLWLSTIFFFIFREIHYGHLINVLYVHVKIQLLCVKMSAVLVLTVIQKR